MNNYTPYPNTSKKNNNTFASVVLVFLIVILGGTWYWYSEIYTPPTIVLPEPLTAMTASGNDMDKNTSLAPGHSTALSESNAIADITTDITNTDLGTLETELLIIDAEIAAAAKIIE